MKYHIDEENPERLGPPELRALIERSPSLTEVILNWIRPGQCLTILPGTNDQKELDSVYIDFEQDKEVVGSYVVRLQDLLEKFSEIEMVGVISRIHTEGSEEAIDEWYDETEKRLGATSDDRLMGVVLPKQSMVEMALYHVLSLNGEARFSIFSELELDDDFVEEGEHESLRQYRGRVIWLAYHHRDPKTGSGWGGDYFVILDSPP